MIFSLREFRSATTRIGSPARDSILSLTPRFGGVFLFRAVVIE